MLRNSKIFTNPDTSGNGAGSATDGDLDAAYALLLAGQKWHDPLCTERGIKVSLRQACEQSVLRVLEEPVPYLYALGVIEQLNVLLAWAACCQSTATHTGRHADCAQTYTSLLQHAFSGGYPTCAKDE